jgi:tetratricopeptide (TPR) repeat protein
LTGKKSKKSNGYNQQALLKLKISFYFYQKELPMHTSLRILVLFLILGAGYSLHAQKSSFSKLKVSRTDEIKPLLDSARRNMLTNPAKSFDYIEKALALSIKSNDKRSEGLCYQTLGIINSELGQPDLAIPYFQRAITIFSGMKEDFLLNETYLYTGDAHAKQGNTSGALENYNQYLRYVSKKGSSLQRKQVRYKIAEAHYEAEDYSQALRNYNELKREEEKDGNQEGLTDVQNRIGLIYQKTNQSGKALDAYKKSEELAKNTNDVDNLSNSLKQQSAVYRNTGQYDRELDKRQEIIDLQEKENKEVGEQNLEIGISYMTRNMPGRAIPYISKSIEIAEKEGDLLQKGEALQSLSTAYSSSGQYNKALEIYRRYVETVDAIYKQKEEENKANLLITTSLNRKIQRLDLIEKELNISNQTVELLKHEQQVSRQELKARKIFNISLISVFAMLSIALFLVYRSSLQKRRANQLLALKSLRSQMNPHFIYNSLNSVNNFISRNDERAANKYLSEFSLLMRAVMDNSKHDFVSLSNEVQILNRYLLLEHSRFGDKFDYSLEVAPDIDADNIPVPPMLIQPFVENAIWHGLRYLENKGFLKISMVVESEKLKVTIADNGIGRRKSEEIKTRFQKEHVSTGMRNVQSRIGIINELYKTRLGVTVSDPEEENATGTIVNISIPVSKNLLTSN